MSRRALAAAAAALLLGIATPAAAQDERALRSFFEGRNVTLDIDMPGTSDGVDVRADSSQPMDARVYRERLEQNGTAIHARESATVTLVKIKGDHIEFQLNGGGYGTFGDDTSTSVYMPNVGPSSRERELDRLIRDEDEPRERRRLEEERDELRERRERRNRQIDADRAAAEARKREELEERRRRGGSRFNLHYEGSVPTGIKPEEVMAALGAYVDFSSLGYRPGLPAVQSRHDQDDRNHRDRREEGGLPRKGMTRNEAELEFGRPVGENEHFEGGLRTTTVRFARGDQQIVADFVEDVLVRFSVSSR